MPLDITTTDAEIGAGVRKAANELFIDETVMARMQACGYVMAYEAARVKSTTTTFEVKGLVCDGENCGDYKVTIEKL